MEHLGAVMIALVIIGLTIGAYGIVTALRSGDNEGEINEREPQR